MSLDPERKVYLVTVTVTETRHARAHVEAESEEDAEESVRADPELLDFGATDEDVDVQVHPDFCAQPKYGCVAGALLAVDSEEYAAAVAADHEHPRDELTLPLFGGG